MIFVLAVARFAISWLDTEYHLEALSNLQKAAENVNKLCGVTWNSFARSSFLSFIEFLFFYQLEFPLIIFFFLFRLLL